MNKVTVLQLCSYFTGSKVHNKLFSQLDKEIQQQIYVPVRIKSKIGSNSFQLQNGALTYDKIWSLYHRILYKNKIQKAFNKFQNLPNDFSCDIIHAHTWFSDGGIAWLLHKQNNKPYIIAVRNTDINVFYKKLIHLKKIGHSILEKASKVVFISPGYYNQLISIIPEGLKERVKNKSVIIPSGIDEFWLENKVQKTKSSLNNKKFNLLYIGEINKNKNIEMSIESFLNLRKQQIDATFTLVGFQNMSRYEKYIAKKYNKTEGLNFVKKINDKKELVKFYQEADLFIMPSLTETFGLVYIEALSQGLPIIYSKGQGVDGYFDNIKVAEAVNPKSIEDVTKALLKIFNNYNQYTPNNLSFLDQFKWSNIASKYIDIYTELLGYN